METDPRRLLTRLWHWSRKAPAERRTDRARARFWAELREGQAEAEARSRRDGDSIGSLAAPGAAQIED